MSVLAPPKPPVHDDPEALIEEARRRARRRRLALVAAAVAGVTIAGIVLAVVLLTGRGGANENGLPAGFTYVPARGPVRHLLVESRSNAESIEIATGNARPAKFTSEIWYDSKSGLDRAALRYDGRLLADLVGQATCVRARLEPTAPVTRFCIDPWPFSYLRQYRWPPDPKLVRVTGKGTFRGRDVIWLEGLVGGHPAAKGEGDTAGLDAHTHDLVVHRAFHEGRIFEQELFTVQRDLPAKSVAFAVPEGGAPERVYPPAPPRATRSRASSLDAVKDVLGAAPFWLGPRFQGHRLRRVEVGTEGIRAKTGRTLSPVMFVRFDYGAFKLQEFGAEKPWWYRTGPRPGRIVLHNGSQAALSRGGLLVLTEWGRESFALSPASALAIARALRPVPGG